MREMEMAYEVEMVEQQDSCCRRPSWRGAGGRDPGEVFVLQKDLPGKQEALDFYSKLLSVKNRWGVLPRDGYWCCSYFWLQWLQWIVYKPYCADFL